MVQNTETLLVADIGLDSRTAGAQAVYTYRVSDQSTVRPGEAYFVPLGPRRAIGFVLVVRETTPNELGFPVSQLRSLGTKIQGLDMPPVMLELVSEVARQTLTSVAVALSLAVPPSIKERLSTTWRRSDAPSQTLSTAQAETLRILDEQGAVSDSKSKPLPDGAKRSLRSLERLGLVTQSVSLSHHQERHRLTGLYRLTSDQKSVEKFLTGAGKKRPAQAVTIMRLQGSESASFSVQEIKSFGGVTDQTIKALIQAELLVEETATTPMAATAPTPNPDQAKAIATVSAAIRSSKNEEFLLFGVTGSGKTEVYLRCAAEALAQGKQILFLVPEIALTAQVIAQLRERFGNLVAVLHSNMSPGERFESWLRVRNGECSVVLGARSAIFAPVTNLGLIIVDEEHETSYKQENSPRYQSKRLVAFLGQRFSCPVIYGSATPSIETFHAAKQGELTLLTLPNRTASARLPDVEIVNLAQLYRERRASIVSPQLEDLLAQALVRGEQAILFLNRRAYSPFLLCRDCGHRVSCRHCAVSLALHRRERKLKCHQCGHQESVPENCAQCGSERIGPFGTGTEKVEEAVQATFPDYKVARLDRDIAKKKGALEETLAAFRSGAVHILVGTQMVAKGLDFPNVTVVGVVAADVSLNVPDFRAGERTFQLLSQVSGRAGRGKNPGVVVIQTLSPENESVTRAKEHDYEGYYQAELEQRRAAGYPPFRRLVNILVTGENRQDVVGLSAMVAQKLKLALTDAEILGPVDCPIEKVQNLWRRHVLVKLAARADVGPIQRILDGLGTSRVRVVIDVDPVSLV